MKKNIIVVDDDQDTRSTLQTLFEHEGYKVTCVTNGIDCLSLLERGFQGIILLDIMMPKMDGWDTLREIVRRGLQQNVNIFIITAIGTVHHEKIHGLESYIRDYIPKPFNPKELIQNVKQFG